VENKEEPKEFLSWDDAFRALAAPIKQQSVRVASYTREIFLAACDRPFAKQSAKSKTEITERLTDVAYQCGLLHQIGKAMLPSQYQVLDTAFSKKQLDTYQTYTTAGGTLSEAIQEKLETAYQTEDSETLRLCGQMVQETCLQHMERWNGSGYPNGYLGKSISPIAQIVGLAKELDRLATETKDEEPFAKAVETLNAQSGTLWNPSLINVLNLCVEECGKIFQNYRYYSLKLPETVHLLEKRDKRKMGLQYRPLVGDRSGTVVAYEAIPWFTSIQNENRQDGMATVDEMLIRTELTERVGTYFLYEATDTLYRIRNCRLDIKAVLLNMPRSFFGNTSQLRLFNELFEDQPIPRGTLLLTIPAESLIDCSKGREDNLKRLLRYEVELVLDDYDPQKIPRDVLEDYGFTYVRLSPEACAKPENVEIIQNLLELNFKILGKNADSKQELNHQMKLGLTFTGGTYTGALVDEDTLIRDSLLREVTA
jgi:EAL domain-containing protein (putative c-di-GMP-specific phosphodiesterase class I)